MMKLYMLGSGSRGNCCAVETEDGFLRVAERVMSRRNVTFSAERRESLRQAFARSTR